MDASSLVAMYADDLTLFTVLLSHISEQSNYKDILWNTYFISLGALAPSDASELKIY